MNNDWSRNFLITKLVCSACGKNLRLSYQKPGYVDCAKGEPTGSDKVELAVCVHPCETCLQPLTDIKRALKTLQEIK